MLSAQFDSSLLPTVSENTPDIDLVKQAAQGDEYAFEIIMRRNNQRLFRTARSILSTDADAEDAVQEAYLRAWGALATFRAEAQLSTWLIRIVVNEALGQLRRKNALLVSLEMAMSSSETEILLALTESTDQQPDWFAMRSELRKMLETQIDLLPEKYRTVFMLRAVEELSVSEVAEALEMPQATVRIRFFRARHLLRKSLAFDMDVIAHDAFSFDGERCNRLIHQTLLKAKKRQSI